MSLLKRLLVFIISGCSLGYLAYLFFTGVSIVNGTNTVNYTVYCLLSVIFLYFIIFYSIKPTYIKFNKIINTILGVFIIMISHYFIINSGHDGIYYGDIFIIIGIIYTVIGPTNLLISKEIQKIKENNNSEIIEIE